MTLCRFTCPECKQSFTMELPDDTDLAKVTCPQCQSILTVKVPSEPPPIPEVPTDQEPPSQLVVPPPIPPTLPPEREASSGQIPLPSDILTQGHRNSEMASSPETSVVPPALAPYAPPTAPVSVAAEHACPLCGRSDPKYFVRGKMLYGHKVCRKCYLSFLNRRQFAFAFDIVAYFILLLGVNFLEEFTVGFVLSATQAELIEQQLEAILLAFNVLNYVLYALWFLFKDGFNGTSLGKAIMGLFVINEATGKRISFGGSAKRNWIIVLLGLVPFAWLIIAVIMGKGYRIGDRAARTKVVWKKYAHSPVFAPNLGAGSPTPS